MYIEKLSVVILNYNDSEHVINLATKVKTFDAVDYVVIVDNCSTDNSYDILKTIANDNIILIQSPRNGGYGYGNNYGIKYSKNTLGCKYSIIANPDVDFDNSTVLALKKSMQESSSQCAVTACKQINTYAKHTRSAWKLPKSPIHWILNKEWIISHIDKSSWYSQDYLESKEAVEVDCVQGAMLLVDLDKFLSFGGYDESIFLYCEEVDLALQLKKNGYTCLYLPNYKYYHYHSQSIRKSYPTLRKQQEMMLKSQMIVMEKYWKIRIIHRILVKFILLISEVEQSVIGLVKTLKD